MLYYICFRSYYRNVWRGKRKSYHRKVESESGRKRIYVLSPAHTGGKRGALLFRPGAAFDLAVRLRTEGAPLGEVYAFISELYFRGKLAYAEAFAAPPDGLPGALVITAGLGLVP